MLDPNISSVFYRNSPFMPPIEINSAQTIIRDVMFEGAHPIIAIALEVLGVCNDHSRFLDTTFDWLSEKFNYSPTDADAYYYGMTIPLFLILSTAETAEDMPEESILDMYFVQTDDEYTLSAREYVKKHLGLAYRLVVPDELDPMLSAEPIYTHCNFDLFSDNFWYFVGLEASKRVYENYARIFQDPIESQ